ncbi:hypothetical protein B0H17DRAFT_922013 [Mycena rosella]|uniref:Retrotransposon gag domain-containing protein n=1 Tax=Mycena rosella TaxID=1033263 RepID=A0AAD7E188_MYCRO|nr:hypothetical protein B0H17DRAFT_922013 [Mycena rosella]
MGGRGGSSAGGGGDVDSRAAEGASGPYVEEWQVNHKLNLSSVPSWDREGTTAISYLAKMSKLAKLGEKMRRSLGNIAANLFTGNTNAWWCSLTDTDQLYFRQDWPTMLFAIREQFLTEAWRRDRSREYEEMRFRQGRGNEHETPLKYLQRRISHYQAHSFGDNADRPDAVARILHNQPVEWGTILNERTCLSIFVLQREVSHNADALINLHELQRQVKVLEAASRSGGAPGRFFNKSKNAVAHVAEAEEAEEDSGLRSICNDSDSEDHVVAEAQAANNHRGSRPKPAKKYRDWPKGGMVDEFHFARRDDVKSPQKPEGKSYICTNGNHYARGCPWYGEWCDMREAHPLWLDVSQEVIDCNNEGFSVMMAAMKSQSVSVLSSEPLKKQVHVMDALQTGALEAHVSPYGDVSTAARRVLETRLRRLDEGKAGLKGTSKQAAGV